MKSVSLALALIFLATFCGTKKTAETAPLDSMFEPGVTAGVITEPILEEASGLAESISNPGYLWTHNDSGDKARLFLITTDGSIKAVVNLANIKNRDWEDIAIGPGPEEGKNYIYIGDIGDNESEFIYKHIYRIEEPTINPTTKDTTIQQVDVITFKYPEGLRDAESLMLDPLTKDLFIISKRELRCNVYRLPFPQSTSDTLSAELAIERIEFDETINGDTVKNGGEILVKGYHPKYYYQIVAADISLPGDEILIKSYSSVFYWKREPNETIVDAIKRTPIMLPYNPEPQGEAITFDLSGEGYYTVNERMKGKEQKLIFYKRR